MGLFSKSVRDFKARAPQVSASNKRYAQNQHGVFSGQNAALSAAQLARGVASPMGLLNTYFLANLPLDAALAKPVGQKVAELDNIFSSQQRLEEEARKRHGDLSVMAAQMFMSPDAYQHKLRTEGTAEALRQFDFRDTPENAPVGQRIRNWWHNLGRDRVLENWLQSDMNRRLETGQRGMVDEASIQQLLAKPRFKDIRDSLDSKWQLLTRTTSPSSPYRGHPNPFVAPPPPPSAVPSAHKVIDFAAPRT